MNGEFGINGFLHWLYKASCVVVLLALATVSSATAVKQLTFTELCDRAKLIFEGRVIASETRIDDSNFGFGTYIRFEVLDRIKGPYVESEIELRFAGGKMGDRQLSIGDMVYPVVGQVGIFFVESMVERQINPLLGWSQGHFIESIDETGRAGVLTSEGVAVLSIQPDAAFQTGDPSSQFKIVSGRSAVKGMELAPSKSSEFQAISVQEFKDHIIDRVDGS